MIKDDVRREIRDISRYKLICCVVIGQVTFLNSLFYVRCFRTEFGVFVQYLDLFSHRSVKIHSTIDALCELTSKVLILYENKYC